MCIVHRQEFQMLENNVSKTVSISVFMWEEETPTLLGPLERANLKQVKIPSFRIPDDGKPCPPPKKKIINSEYYNHVRSTVQVYRETMWDVAGLRIEYLQPLLFSYIKNNFV
jgi:hypothetical protein